MISILSPAKTLNMDNFSGGREYTSPVFIKEASQLMRELLKYSPPEMESFMKINSELAELNFRRHVRWNKTHSEVNSKQALLAYHGAVYQGINAETLSNEELRFANEHIRIISALYGIVRPMDLVQPYRLEMGFKLENPRGKDLYCFWKETITNCLNKELKTQRESTFINLASNEYFSAIDRNKLDGDIITPVFKEYKNGVYKVITIYAKRARGLMTRYIIDNHIDCPEKLKEFEEEDYSFNEGLSKENEWVFTR